MTDDWGTGLAETKLHPPESPGHLVRRSRLEHLLDAGVEGRTRLVLVSAPAGSGKSTLMASWSARRTDAVAWLQLEESDSDPARFWTLLIQATGRIHPIRAEDLIRLVVGSNGDDAVVVPALVNALVELRDPVVVILDDYHLVDDPGVHRGVERLVGLCPTQLTIVLSTRFDPPFRIGRLRIRDQVVEIRSAELRFEPEEARALLGPVRHSMGRPLIDELCSRSEGWAAGLVLAGISLTRTADHARFVREFSGDDHLVVEYLRDELLATLDPRDHRVLLETSVLEELTGPLVDAVTTRTGGGEWLRATADTNQLLIRLDRPGKWFRLHHLLRDLMRMEAEREIPDQLSELHRRAGIWFEDRGDHERAVVHRLAAGDTAVAIELMATCGPRLLRAGQIESLRRLLASLGEAARTSTACALLTGWCEFIGGNYSSAADWLDTALEAAPDGFDRTITTSLRINISLARGDVDSAMQDARNVVDEMVSHPADLATAVGAAETWAGYPDAARSALNLAVERATAEDSSTAHVLALVYRAIVDFEDGRSAAAHAAAADALDTAHRLGLSSYYGVAPAFAIRARTGDDAASARADALYAVDMARKSSSDLVLAFILAASADTLADLGEPDGATLLREAQSLLERCPDPGVVGRYLDRAASRHDLKPATTNRSALLGEHLTDRELAVLRYLPSAMSQRDIAGDLYVSLNTVKTHCRSIYRKLGVSSRKAAVQAARDLGVI